MKHAYLQFGDRSTYIEPNFIYFKIGNSNTMYNLYDAGNFMWGAWGNARGHSYGTLKAGSQANELWQDSNADQQTIKNGYNWMSGILNKRYNKR